MRAFAEAQRPYTGTSRPAVDLRRSILSEEIYMRLRTYRDETYACHLDLVGGNDTPWKVDLVKWLAGCVLVTGLCCALVAQIV
jgi:hypothetical protein